MADARPPHVRARLRFDWRVTDLFCKPEAILLFPIDLAPNTQLNIDLVSASLYRLAALSATVPYKWGFIDRPRGNCPIDPP